MEKTSILNKILRLSRSKKEYLHDNFGDILSVLKTAMDPSQMSQTNYSSQPSQYSAPATPQAPPAVEAQPPAQEAPSTPETEQGEIVEKIEEKVSPETSVDLEIITFLGNIINKNASLATIKQALTEYGQRNFANLDWLDGQLNTLLSTLEKNVKISEDNRAKITQSKTILEEPIDSPRFINFMNKLYTSVTGQEPLEETPAVAGEKEPEAKQYEVVHGVFSVPVEEKQDRSGKTVYLPTIKHSDFLNDVISVFGGFKKERSDLSGDPKSIAISMIQDYYSKLDDAFSTGDYKESFKIFIRNTRANVENAIISQYTKGDLSPQELKDPNIRIKALASANEETMNQIYAADPELKTKVDTINFFQQVGSDLFGYYVAWNAYNDNSGGEKKSKDFYQNIMNLANVAYGNNLYAAGGNPLSMAFTSPESFLTARMKDEDKTAKLSNIEQAKQKLMSSFSGTEEELIRILDADYSADKIKYLTNVNNNASSYAMQTELIPFVKNRENLKSFCRTCGRFRQAIPSQHTKTGYIVWNSDVGHFVFNKAMEKNDPFNYEIPENEKLLLSPQSQQMVSFECDGTSCDLTRNVLLKEDVTQDNFNEYLGFTDTIFIGGMELAIDTKSGPIPVPCHESYSKNLQNLMDRLSSNSQLTGQDPNVIANDMRNFLQSFFKLFPMSFTDQDTLPSPFVGNASKTVGPKLEEYGELSNKIIDYIVPLIKTERPDITDENDIEHWAAKEFYKLLMQYPNRTFLTSVFGEAKSSSGKVDVFRSKEKTMPFKGIGTTQEDNAKGILQVNNMEFFNRFKSEDVRVLTNYYTKSLALSAYEKSSNEKDAMDKVSKEILRIQTGKIPVFPGPPPSKEGDGPGSKGEWHSKYTLFEAGELTEEKDPRSEFLFYLATSGQLLEGVRTLMNEMYSKVEPPDIIQNGFYDFFIKKSKVIDPNQFTEKINGIVQERIQAGTIENNPEIINNLKLELLSTEIGNQAVDQACQEISQIYGHDAIMVRASIIEEIKRLIESKEVTLSRAARDSKTSTSFMTALISDSTLTDLYKNIRELEKTASQPKIPEGSNIEHQENIGYSQAKYPVIVDDWAKFLMSPDAVSQYLIENQKSGDRLFHTKRGRQVLGNSSLQYLQSPEHSNEIIYSNLGDLKANAFFGTLLERHDAQNVWSHQNIHKSLMSYSFAQRKNLKWSGVSVPALLGLKQGVIPTARDIVPNAPTAPAPTAKNKNNWYKTAQKTNPVKSFLITSDFDAMACENNIFAYSLPQKLFKAVFPVIILVPFEYFGSVSKVYSFCKNNGFKAIPVTEKEEEALGKMGIKPRGL